MDIVADNARDSEEVLGPMPGFWPNSKAGTGPRRNANQPNGSRPAMSAQDIDDIRNIDEGLRKQLADLCEDWSRYMASNNLS